jgi:hypothetical protein
MSWEEFWLSVAGIAVLSNATGGLVIFTVCYRSQRKQTLIIMRALADSRPAGGRRYNRS